MTRRRTSHGGSRRKKLAYYWDGVQFPPTLVTTARLFSVLVDRVDSEDRGRVLQTIRGYLTYQNGGTDAQNGAVRVVSKIMMFNLNDAGAVTDDTGAIDTQEEDIALRQLWTYSTVLPGALGLPADSLPVTIEIEVKVKIVIPPNGKVNVALMTAADVTNRCLLSGYLRALVV